MAAPASSACSSQVFSFLAAGSALLAAAAFASAGTAAASGLTTGVSAASSALRFNDDAAGDELLRSVLSFSLDI